MTRPALAALASLAIAAGGVVASDDDAGERVFHQCEACHSIIDDNAGMTGPNLAGVVGRAAASLPDFAYSDPMTTAGKRDLVWTPDALDVYLAVPHGRSIEFRVAGRRRPRRRDRLSDKTRRRSLRGWAAGTGEVWSTAPARGS
jgi:cytochrome c